MDQLLEEVEVVESHGDPAATFVTSVELDSRDVRPGSLFCCVPGRHQDGHAYAGEAVERGAVALLGERPLPLTVTQAVVAPGQVRPAMARVAASFYGHPSTSLVTVGVTGTNGKTTVSHLLAGILEAHGWPTTVIGTLDGARTTPEAPALQRLLATARDDGRRAVSMEVSSHALAQRRVDGVTFAAAVFTNLSRDHLDYHGTMEAYFDAKASLFVPDRTALGVVNADDPWGRRLIDDGIVPLVTYSLEDAHDVASRPGRTAFTWRGRRVEMALTGRFQVANALAAATTASALEIPEDAIVSGLGGAQVVPGRFEVVPAAAPFTVVVDYAHTPDGLASALDAARILADGKRVVCVFGCGGDRDPGKRPVMGAVAAERADAVVLTSDNPRSEDPEAIIAAVLAGVPDPGSVTVRVDRAEALEAAVALARRGDVVVVAGKGHEQEIETSTGSFPFDDRTVAADLLARRFGAPGAASRP